MVARNRQYSSSQKAKLIFGVNTGVYYKWSNKLAQGETILPENGRERKLGGGRTHTCKAADEKNFVDTLRTLKEETKMDIPFQTAQVLLFRVAKPDLEANPDFSVATDNESSVRPQWRFQPGV